MTKSRDEMLIKTVAKAAIRFMLAPFILVTERVVKLAQWIQAKGQRVAK